MINVLKKLNWSDAFLLPLTGLRKDDKFDMRSHLFWNEYNINDYKLILTFSCDDYHGMLDYCKNNVFPILDKKGYLSESYDIDGKCIFVLDMSEWAKDIEMFILGRYSKFSKVAKNIIEKFHTKRNGDIPISIKAPLYPNMEMLILGNRTPIEYVAAEYELNLSEMKRLGEIGSIYNAVNETLSVS